jgi:hypothetical protein
MIGDKQVENELMPEIAAQAQAQASEEKKE